MPTIPHMAWTSSDARFGRVLDDAPPGLDIASQDRRHLFADRNQLGAFPPVLTAQLRGVGQHHGEPDDDRTADESEHPAQQPVEPERQAGALYEVAEQAADDPGRDDRGEEQYQTRDPHLKFAAS